MIHGDNKLQKRIFSEKKEAKSSCYSPWQMKFKDTPLAVHKLAQIRAMPRQHSYAGPQLHFLS